MTETYTVVHINMHCCQCTVGNFANIWVFKIPIYNLDYKYMVGICALSWALMTQIIWPWDNHWIIFKFKLNHIVNNFNRLVCSWLKSFLNWLSFQIKMTHHWLRVMWPESQELKVYHKILINFVKPLWSLYSKSQKTGGLKILLPYLITNWLKTLWKRAKYQPNHPLCNVCNKTVV